MPVPSAGQNFFQTGMFRFPAQFLLQFIGRRHQGRRIPCSCRFFGDADILLGHFFRHLNDPSDGMPLSGPHIKSPRLFPVQSQNMGRGQIPHVNVIPDAGSIRRCMPGSENLDIIPLPKGIVGGIGLQVMALYCP